MSKTAALATLYVVPNDLLVLGAVVVVSVLLLAGVITAWIVQLIMGEAE